MPYRNEPPPGSLSLFFCTAAAWAETAERALVPGNTAGFTTGTARQGTREPRPMQVHVCGARAQQRVREDAPTHYNQVLKKQWVSNPKPQIKV